MILRAIASGLRRLADRLDAPRELGLAACFTFEAGEGLVWNDELRGCPAWFMEEDYELAWTEARRRVT